MDPITALSQEFARVVQADWSQEAAVGRSEHATPAPHTGLVARLCQMLGAGLVTLGMRLQGQERVRNQMIGHSSAQIGQ